MLYLLSKNINIFLFPKVLDLQLNRDERRVSVYPTPGFPVVNTLHYYVHFPQLITQHQHIIVPWSPYFIQPSLVFV